MTETIALFGGTGRTGSHVVKYALEKGYKVQMLARSPSKIEVKHANLTVIKGDLMDAGALEAVVHGASYVVSCVSGPYSSKTYPIDMMINFVKLLFPIMSAEPSVKVFLYQAGAFSAAPGKPLSFMSKIMRSTIGTLFGMGPMIRDNEAVIFYTAETSKNFDVIVTRPSMLEEKESDMVVVADHDNIPSGAITFQGLAVFSVNALKDSSLYGTYPFVAPKK